MEARAELPEDDYKDPLALEMKALPGIMEVEDPHPPELKRPDLRRAPTMLPSAWTWTWRRIFYRGITTGSVSFSPLFALFTYQAITQIHNLVLKEFGAEDSDWASGLFSLLAIYFSATYFVCDPPSVDPIEESERLLHANALEREAKQNDEPGWAFAITNKVLSIPCYMHVAADNAIAMAALTGNNLKYYLTIGIPLTAFGEIHQYVVSKRDIELHSHRFVKAFGSRAAARATLTQLAITPLVSLEAFMECSSYVAYYGISGGYIAGQLALIIGLKQTDPVVVPWILTTTIMTAHVTAFSKVLAPYDHYFNPLFKDLSPAELKAVSLPWTTIFLDSGIALTRATAFGWLTARFGPQNPLASGLLTSGVCLFTFFHPLDALYQKRIRETALVTHNKQKQLAQLFAASQHNQDWQDHTPRSEKLFNHISKRFEKPKVRQVVTVLNISARIGQSLSFIGFVADVFGTLNANGYNLPFNFKDTVALGLLWGAQIAIQDGTANQEALIHSWAYHRTKHFVGAPTETIAKKNIVTRTLASFFYSKAQFSERRLQKALRALQSGVTIDGIKNEKEEMKPLNKTARP